MVSADTDTRLQVGNAFLAALRERSFDRLGEILGPTMRMRALLPTGHYDFAGSAEATAAFAEWFGTASELEVQESRAEEVADRLRLSYRFRVRRPQEDFTIIEQQAYCKVVDGRIVTLDLLCSGFRQPAPPPGSELE